MSLPSLRVALVLSDLADREALRALYARSGWSAYTAATVREAARLLEADRMDLIVCDYALADGSWRDILAITGSRASDCPMVVASRFADEHMWAEVLNLGGFDMLAKPFDAQDILRVS